MYQGSLLSGETISAIQELRNEHGSFFVDGMVATGKRLLFTAAEGKLNAAFPREHLVALRYALTSMGVHDYMTEHDASSRGKKLLFHFEADDAKLLLAEKQQWDKEHQQKAA